MTVKHIKIDIPQDIVYSIEKLGKSKDIAKEIKISLAVTMFQRNVISLGKATELAEMSRVKFIELLKEYNIPAYEYREKDYAKDQKTINSIT